MEAALANLTVAEAAVSPARRESALRLVRFHLEVGLGRGWGE